MYAELAVDFEHSQRAIDFALQYVLTGVQLSVQFVDAEIEGVRLPELEESCKGGNFLTRWRRRSCRSRGRLAKNLVGYAVPVAGSAQRHEARVHSFISLRRN